MRSAEPHHVQTVSDSCLSPSPLVGGELQLISPTLGDDFIHSKAGPSAIDSCLDFWADAVVNQLYICLQKLTEARHDGGQTELGAILGGVTFGSAKVRS